MSQVKIEVNPQILKWVYQLSLNTDLDEKNKEKLDDWINNKSNPTISQLRRISKKLKFPFGYFFLSEVPKENLELLNFRTVNNYEISNPSRDLIDVINHIESKQVWLSETRRNQGFERNIFNGGFIKNGSKKNFQQVAEDILKMLDLEIGWNIATTKDRFNLLKSRLENVGVTVMYSSYVINNTRRKLNVDEFRAFAIADEYAPFIFINANDSLNAKFFSLVHEMVHIWYGTSELYNDDFKSPSLEVTEQDINHVVECLLFPEKLVKEVWTSIGKDYDVLDKVDMFANDFGVSMFSAAIALKNKGFITQNEVNEIRDNSNVTRKENKKNSSGGPNYYTVKVAHLSKDFISEVKRSADSGEITYSKAFELTDVKNQKAYDNLLKKLKGNSI
ncbi:DNA-binding protein [Lactobacillus sp. UMNPBX2]|nr:DNA-binding protein [Lactobacillus sp. UMNPBX2]